MNVEGIRILNYDTLKFRQTRKLSFSNDRFRMADLGNFSYLVGLVERQPICCLVASCMPRFVALYLNSNSSIWLFMERNSQINSSHTFSIKGVAKRREQI